MYVFEGPICMYFQAERISVWILISWYQQNLADLDLQCFQNRITLGSTGQGIILASMQ